MENQLENLRQQLLDALVQKASEDGRRIADRYTREIQRREQELADLPPLLREKFLSQHSARLSSALSRTLERNRSEFNQAASLLSQIIASQERARKQAERAASPRKPSATELNMGPYAQLRGQYPDAYLKWLFGRSLAEGQQLDPAAHYQEWYRETYKKGKSTLLEELPLANQNISEDIQKLRSEGYSEDQIYASLKSLGLRPEDFGIEKKKNLIPDWIPFFGRF